MAVDIQLIGDPASNEYQAAEQLRSIFIDFLPEDTEGRIYIQVNVLLFGQRTREVDLITFGSLDNFKLNLGHKPCLISDFCFCIEIKDHCVEDLQIRDSNLFVPYKAILKDVSNQSFKASFSVAKHFATCLGFEPYVCNFIWLRNVSEDNLTKFINRHAVIQYEHNFLAQEFTLPSLFKLAFGQNNPFRRKGDDFLTFSCGSTLSESMYADFSPLFNLFDVNRDNMGELTRQKLELLTKKILDKQLYAQQIGKMLVIVAGRAGTGKTIKLLRIAYDLAANHGKRCLILSYNRALVSDIRRTLALVRMPFDIDSQSVDIQTLYQFFLPFLRKLIVSDPKTRLFEMVEQFDPLMIELNEYVTQGAITKSELMEVMAQETDTIGLYDHVLIDEAQDWRETERSILINIFGYDRILIADGIDQMVRGRERCDWSRGVPFEKTTERRSLRQKCNLVRFVNAYANSCNLNWELSPKEELHGGRIIITTKPYEFDLHLSELRKCEAAGNKAYDMLLLVPPTLVHREYGSGGKKTKSYCTLIPSLTNSDDVLFWDGTATAGENETEYPTHPNQHRVFQYESCRGLEGWTVVCVELDELIEFKMRAYKDLPSVQTSADTAFWGDDEKRNRFVFLWSLIPLTRAIDSLVITIKDKNSETSERLQKLAREFSDFVEWID